MSLMHTSRIPFELCCHFSVRWRRQPAVHRLRGNGVQWCSAFGKRIVSHTRSRCPHQLFAPRGSGCLKPQAYVASSSALDDDGGDKEPEKMEDGEEMGDLNDLDDLDDLDGLEDLEDLEGLEGLEGLETLGDDDDDSSSTALMVDRVVEMIKEGSEDIEVDTDGLLEADEAPAEVQEDEADEGDDSDPNSTDVLKGEEEATVVEGINDLIDEYGYYPEEVPINKKKKKKATVKERDPEPDPPIDPEYEWYYRDVEREECELVEILQTAGYGTMADQFKEEFPGFKIRGMQSDWDKVQEGDLYFCDRTEHFDGFGFIDIALEKGAVAVACEHREDDMEENEVSLDQVPYLIFADFPDAMARMACAYYRHPSSEMTVIGVTGTTGKTTVSWLIRSILEQHGKSTGMMSDTEHAVNANYLDLDGNIWKSDEVDVAKIRDTASPYHIAPYTGRYRVDDTLPNSLQIQKLLRGMASRGAECCVIECPSFYLAQRHLQYVDFTLGVFTNSNDEATESNFEDFQSYKSAQGRLFKGLDDPSRQRAIINLDGDHAEEFVNYARDVPVVTYSLYPGADVYIVHAKYTMWDTELVVHTPLGRMRVVTGLIGKDNVENVLAAIAAGISIDTPLQTILEGLEALEAVPGRMEVIDEGQEPPFAVVVDNASTPSRLERLLDNARNSGVKRILLVMGSKGCGDSKVRAKMMEVAHFKAHMVFVTNDSPIYEHPKSIVDDIILGIPENIRDQYSLWVYNPFQDPGRVPWWFEDFLRAAQHQSRRYVVEDRSLAIRTAIGTAQEGDVVVIAGRGDEDMQQFPDKTGEELLTGWFDDRCESRDALRKLRYLETLKIERKTIPWTSPSN